MRNIIGVFIVLLFSGVWLSSAGASIARGRGGARPQVGNRSAGMSHANIDGGNVNRNAAGLLDIVRPRHLDVKDLRDKAQRPTPSERQLRP
jgi:hypothetical protein